MARLPAALFLVLLAAAPARAARFSLTSGTIAWGDDVLAADGHVVPRRRLVSRLGLLALPESPSGRWVFASDLRLAVDAGLDRHGQRPEGVPARTVDVPYAYLAGRGLLGDRLDVTVGRSLRWDVADLYALDGLQAAVRGPWHLGAEVFSGLVVRREASWLPDPELDPDGTVHAPAQTPTLGAGLLLHGSSALSGRAGWRRAWEDSRLVTDVLQGSLRTGSLAGLRADAAARWDLVFERFERAEAGLVWAPGSRLELEARAARLRPVFDLDSIFPCFAFGPTDDASLAVRGRTGRWRGWARGVLRRFLPGEFQEADLPAAVTDSARAAGLSGGVVADVAPAARGGLAAAWQDGHGGGWWSLMLHGSAGLLGERLQADGRLRWTRFSADLLSAHEGHALQALAGLSWPFADRGRVHVTSELDLTPRARPSLRLFGLLDLGFVL